jgi:DNA-binding NtrC family response regulator
MQQMFVKRVAIAVPGFTPVTPIESVLLVSADADFRAVAGRVLRRACYAAETAAHSGHALLACMRQPFDVILVDEVTVERAATLVAGLVKHCPRARVATISEKPQSAEDLLALVATSSHRAGTENRR